MLIDSHAHLNFQEYDSELDDVIQRSFDNQTWVINVGSNYETSQKAVAIADKFGKGIWAAIGCHPIHLIKDITETTVFDGAEQSFFTPKEKFNYNKYLQLAQSSEQVVALGETGLDFFRMSDAKDSIEEVKAKQTEVFEQFIKMGKELNLPLILHCRGEEKDPYGAYDLMLEILGKWQMANGKLSGVIHCFGGNLTQALKFIDLGFYIGFTGIITFKNAKELQAIAKEIPLEKILIETDAPFLAPEPYRGKKNEPTFVRYVAQKIADLKEITFDQVEKQTFDNAVELFNL